jgi:hypothetical protein
VYRTSLRSKSLTQNVYESPEFFGSCPALVRPLKGLDGAPECRSARVEWPSYSSLWFTMLITLPSGAHTRNLRTPHASSVSG